MSIHDHPAAGRHLRLLSDGPAIMTDEEAHQVAYLAAIRPLTELSGTEHDAWKRDPNAHPCGFAYEPDDVWLEAVRQADRNLDALRVLTRKDI